MFALIKKIQAKRYGVPFRKKEWYNFQAMLPKEEQKEHPHIEIFDRDGKYIHCPGIGGFVTYALKGEKYKYKIVGFKNESRNRDWLYESDYINPIIEFVCKAEE